jgi:hypothetical protein
MRPLRYSEVWRPWFSLSSRPSISSTTGGCQSKTSSSQLASEVELAGGYNGVFGFRTVLAHKRAPEEIKKTYRYRTKSYPGIWICKCAIYLYHRVCSMYTYFNLFLRPENAWYVFFIEVVEIVATVFGRFELHHELPVSVTSSKKNCLSRHCSAELK